MTSNLDLSESDDNLLRMGTSCLLHGLDLQPNRRHAAVYNNTSSNSSHSDDLVLSHCTVVKCAG